MSACRKYMKRFDEGITGKMKAAEFEIFFHLLTIIQVPKALDPTQGSVQTFPPGVAQGGPIYPGVA